MKYRGILARPIARSRLSLLYDEHEEMRRIAEEMLAKLPELAALHGVRNFDYSQAASFALMLSLARAHVPGLRVAAPPGRPKGLSELDKAYLRRDVEVAMVTGKSMGEAIEVVMQSGQWRDRLKGKSVSAIGQQLKEGALWLRVVTDAAALGRRAHADDNKSDGE